jgi:hypothetical protein
MACNRSAVAWVSIVTEWFPAEFLPEFPACCLRRSFVRFDAATDHLQEWPVSVFPLEDEPNTAVLLQSEHAGAIFNLDELVNRLGALWKYDAILANAHKVPLVYIPAGD